MNFEPTTTWYLALAPEIALVILLFAIQIYSRVLPADKQRGIGIMTAWGALVIILLTVSLSLFGGVPNTTEGLQGLGESLIWGGMIRNDAITFVFRIMFFFALMITALISVDVERLQAVEYYALLIIATMGFSLMAASADLIMLYISLEMASISSYILAGFLKNEERSAESGMKYFVFGAFATGLMLYGMSLLYGLSILYSQGVGLTNIYALGNLFTQLPPMEVIVTDPILQNVNGVLLLAAVLVVAGFGFKISAVPYHFWTPDVYEGSPTAFTAFLSTASKAAAFAVFIRVFTAGVFGPPQNNGTWWAMLLAMCLITMTIGNLSAIFQNNIKRMLAYSSIAQAGYALLGLVILTPAGAGATMFYLLMYVFTNIAAFGVIIVVTASAKSESMEELYGLNKRSPYLALVMMVALLSLGGIPPTAGFLGKFYLFQATVNAGYWGLALFAILNAFVALYYYLNVIKYMYLYDSDKEAVAIPVSRSVWVGLGISTFAILLLGIYSSPAYEWTLQAAGAFYALAGG